MSGPVNRQTSAVSSARLFATAGARYWLQAFPAARRSQRRLLASAESISDPVLREDALIAHRKKRSNSEGLAALAVLAPAERRAELSAGLAAYQLMLDYLDGVSERRTSDPIANGMRLHEAFEVAMDPGADHVDYYEYVGRDDNGYLLALIDACRAPLGHLPSYPTVQSALQRQARLCQRSQALNHALRFSSLDGEIDEWAAETTALLELEEPFEWWELLAAAAASSLSIGALLALAARPGVTEADARQVEFAYFPWASGLNALLDSLVDLDEDPVDASHVRRYDTVEDAAERLASIASCARERVSGLPEGSLHETILVAMAALYLARPEAWRQGREVIAQRVFAELGPLARPALYVHVLRRGGRGAGTLFAARPRSHEPRRRGILSVGR